jgi:hypothetical protein
MYGQRSLRASVCLVYVRGRGGWGWVCGVCGGRRVREGTDSGTAGARVRRGASLWGCNSHRYVLLLLTALNKGRGDRSTVQSVIYALLQRRQGAEREVCIGMRCLSSESCRIEKSGERIKNRPRKYTVVKKMMRKRRLKSVAYGVIYRAAEVYICTCREMRESKRIERCEKKDLKEEKQRKDKPFLLLSDIVG